MFYLLLIVFFYISTCIGIIIRISMLPECNVSISWVIIFPLVYVYIFYLLLLKKYINCIMFLKCLRHSIGLCSLLYAISNTKIKIKDLKIKNNTNLLLCETVSILNKILKC